MENDLAGVGPFERRAIANNLEIGHQHTKGLTQVLTRIQQLMESSEIPADIDKLEGIKEDALKALEELDNTLDQARSIAARSGFLPAQPELFTSV